MDQRSGKYPAIVPERPGQIGTSGGNGRVTEIRHPATVFTATYTGRNIVGSIPRNVLDNTR